MNKLLKEYLEFIGEAPIEDISHIGNTDTATNFTKPEIKMLKSEKYEKRLRNAFSKTPFVFDIVFLYHDKFDASNDKVNKTMSNYDIPNRDYVDNQKYKLGQFNQTIEGTPNKITFVLLGNLSPTDKIPITPWMLAHKIGHAINIRNKSIFVKRMNFIDAVTNLEKYIVDRDKSEFEKIILKPQFENIFSFRSWIKDKSSLIYTQEFPIELVALYLTSGKITPNTNDKIAINLCNEINKELENIFDSLKGKVINDI